MRVLSTSEIEAIYREVKEPLPDPPVQATKERLRKRLEARGWSKRQIRNVFKSAAREFIR